MTKDDEYLAKLVSVGMSVDKIARKLGTTVEDIETRWKRIQTETQALTSNGYLAFCEAFTDFAQRYQSLGEGMKVIFEAFGSVMSIEEIQQLVTDDREQTLHNLTHNAIVLRRFVPAATPPANDNPVDNFNN